MLVLGDLFWEGLGTANGRFVSFLDSINNCYEYRAQKPVPPAATDTAPRTRTRRESQYHLGMSAHMMHVPAAAASPSIPITPESLCRQRQELSVGAAVHAVGESSEVTSSDTSALIALTLGISGAPRSGQSTQHAHSVIYVLVPGEFLAEIWFWDDRLSAAATNTRSSHFSPPIAHRPARITRPTIASFSFNFSSSSSSSCSCSS